MIIVHKSLYREYNPTELSEVSRQILDNCYLSIPKDKWRLRLASEEETHYFKSLATAMAGTLCMLIPIPNNYSLEERRRCSNRLKDLLNTQLSGVERERVTFEIVNSDGSGLVAGYMLGCDMQAFVPLAEELYVNTDKRRERHLKRAVTYPASDKPSWETLPIKDVEGFTLCGGALGNRKKAIECLRDILLHIYGIIDLGNATETMLHKARESYSKVLDTTYHTADSEFGNEKAKVLSLRVYIQAAYINAFRTKQIKELREMRENKSL